ncbi:MAG: membrane dipeptidase [Clostridiales bacterium]|nr:membrane dipeptidase [Clostridiales bacterium]
MNFFDLHCDTIGECYLQKKSLKTNDLHISLDKAKDLEKWAQLFAIWIPDEKRGQEALQYFKNVYDVFLREIQNNESDISFCRNSEDIDKAFKASQYSALLGVEGGAAIAGRLENLDFLYDCGVRLMTLTWNDSNEIANGCFSKDTSGLTAFGKETVKYMQGKNMIVDVSHLNRKGFYDVVDITEKPFVASHSNSDKVYSHPRNLTDEQIDIMIERKCLIGLNLYTKFLGESEQSGCDEALKHAYHILERGGEKVLAMGTDFDGCTVADKIAGIDKISVLADYFENHGISKQSVENIFFDNAKIFFSRVLQMQ